MKIEYVELEKCIPYEFNNRKHSKEQIDRVANSISQFGFNQPVVLDENNIILVGHARIEAAYKLGLDKVPALKLRTLTEAQKKAYRILDNKLQNDSEWNFESLELELNALEEMDFELEEWGLDELKSLFPEEEAEATDDDFDEAAALESEPFIKRGDLIELGRHRVLCGDSTSAEDVGYLLGSATIDLIWTDPPYGVNHVGGTKDPRRKTHRTGGIVTNDDLGEEGTELQVKQALEAFDTKAKAGCAAYIASPAGTLLPHFIAAMAGSFPFKHSLVWVKNAFVFGRADYHYRHELILYGWKKGAHYFTDDRTLDSVIEAKRGDPSIAHPTSKPVELVAFCVGNSTRAGESVADPFLGSGTTLIAADQLDRICYGMEIEPKYCQVIIDRYYKYCTDRNKPFECKINGEPYFG